MLTRDSPRSHHLIQNASLVFTSLVFLPLSTFILLLSYAIQILVPSQDVSHRRRRIRRSPHFYPKTVLVTGVGMAKGLKIARAFYETGHRVIGADFEPHGVPVNGRFSKALSNFYRLRKPSAQHGAALYIRDLLDIVHREKVDLWVSCSGVASAVEDGQAKEIVERKTSCRCIQFDVAMTSTLHEKDSFIRYTEKLGLPTPETHEVTSRQAVHMVLNEGKRRRKQYILKSVGMDDSSREAVRMPLPRRTLSQTYNYVSTAKITQQSPYVLQQFIKGEEYCTHAIVVNGEVKAFTSCPSLELLMHYQALPPDSGLSRAMLAFTKEFAAKAGPNFTGHLSFDFLVDEVIENHRLEKKILPIECNPRAHTANILFQDRDSSEAMVNAYLGALAPSVNGHGKALTNGTEDDHIAYAKSFNGFYWAGHDLVSLVLHPLLHLLQFRTGIWPFLQSCLTFVNHVIFWKDGTYEVWDPLPWWWLYHIYWPGQFLVAMQTGKKWSRVNVSTTKMFEC